MRVRTLIYIYRIGNQREKKELKLFFLSVNHQHTSEWNTPPFYVYNVMYCVRLHLKLLIMYTIHSFIYLFQLKYIQRTHTRIYYKHKEISSSLSPLWFSILIPFLPLFYPPLFIQNITYCQIHNSLRVRRGWHFISLSLSLLFAHSLFVFCKCVQTICKKRKKNQNKKKLSQK